MILSRTSAEHVGGKHLASIRSCRDWHVVLYSSSRTQSLSRPSSSHGQEEDFKCVFLCASQEEKAFRGGRTIWCQVCSPCAFSHKHEEIITITTWELTVCSGCIFYLLTPFLWEHHRFKGKKIAWLIEEGEEKDHRPLQVFLVTASCQYHTRTKRLLYVSNTLLEHNPWESDRHKWMQCSKCFRENAMTIFMLGLASQKRICTVDLWLLFTISLGATGRGSESNCILVLF